MAEEVGKLLLLLQWVTLSSWVLLANDEKSHVPTADRVARVFNGEDEDSEEEDEEDDGDDDGF